MENNCFTSSTFAFGLINCLSDDLVHFQVLSVIILVAIVIAIFIYLFIAGIVGKFKKKTLMDSFYIGVDAYGKKYAVANNEEWFFKQLNMSTIKKIIDHIKYIEKWRAEKISKCKNNKQLNKFKIAYSIFSKKVFCCEIYRSQTLYSQKDYVKEPYNAKIGYYSSYYTIEQMIDAILAYCDVDDLITKTLIDYSDSLETKIIDNSRSPEEVIDSLERERANSISVYKNLIQKGLITQSEYNFRIAKVNREIDQKISTLKPNK